MSATTYPDQPASMCVPNIGKAGKQRRIRIGTATILVGLVLLGWMISAHTPWFVRLVVFFPAAAAAITLLQVSRKTCIAMAARGVRENEDFSTTPVEKAVADASRRVASTIYRDGVLIGLGASVVAALTAFIR